MFSVIFPGQGSQSVGMIKELYDNFAYARDLFKEADDSLGYSISKIILEGPKEDLDLTENTQPAIFLVGYSIIEMLKKESNFKLDAAKYFGTEIIIDVEGDKIYTDPKYVDLIVNSLQNSDVDFITGNDSLEKFDPTFWFHGFVPAGFKVNALAKICELKKTNNTETGYKEFFTSNNIIKCKFLLPESDISIPEKNRFTLDYPEDYELCKKIFQELGNNFGVKEVINLMSLVERLNDLLVFLRH